MDGRFLGQIKAMPRNRRPTRRAACQAVRQAFRALETIIWGIESQKLSFYRKNFRSGIG
jgi:hypothetical protein